jgi:hypothetical protein
MDVNVRISLLVMPILTTFKVTAGIQSIQEAAQRQQLTAASFAPEMISSIAVLETG